MIHKGKTHIKRNCFLYWYFFLAIYKWVLHLRVKPMTFEYHWSKRFGTIKIELIYFFNSSKIIDIVKVGRKDSRTRCFPIGPTFVVVCCVKTVSIDVIPRIFLDPISKVVGYLSQLGTHRRISLALEVFAS
jgi:glycosyltransferase involved in cell wall biosynthesis